MSETLAPHEPRPAGLPLLERVAMAVLERALPHLEGGTLEVRLPDGTSAASDPGRPLR